MGFFKDMKKAKKKHDARMKKIDKLFGTTTKKAAAPKPAKEKEPKEVEKTYKLTSVNEALLKEAVEEYQADLEQDDGGRWYVEYEGQVVGYLPAVAAKYLENHEDDFNDISLDEDGTATLSFIVE